jgi:hypothetical protein
MKTDVLRRGTVEEVRLDRFAHITPQLIPGVRLGDRALTKRFGDKAAIGFLGNFKYEFLHNSHFTIDLHLVGVGPFRVGPSGPRTAASNIWAFNQHLLGVAQHSGAPQ